MPRSTDPNITAEFPASFDQERLYATEMTEPGLRTYNMPLHSWIEGGASALDVAETMAML